MNVSDQVLTSTELPSYFCGTHWIRSTEGRDAVANRQLASYVTKLPGLSKQLIERNTVTEEPTTSTSFQFLQRSHEAIRL